MNSFAPLNIRLPPSFCFLGLLLPSSWPFCQVLCKLCEIARNCCTRPRWNSWILYWVAPSWQFLPPPPHPQLAENCQWVLVGSFCQFGATNLAEIATNLAESLYTLHQTWQTSHELGRQAMNLAESHELGRNSKSPSTSSVSTVIQ